MPTMNMNSKISSLDGMIHNLAEFEYFFVLRRDGNFPDDMTGESPLEYFDEQRFIARTAFMTFSEVYDLSRDKHTV